MLEKRIKVLAELGKQLSSVDGEIESIIQKTYKENPWFTRENVLKAVQGIASAYLNEKALSELISNYNLPVSKPKVIGLVLAGNIPLVGIHDVICTYISGHQAQIKLSDKDKVLMTYFLTKLFELDANANHQIKVVDKLDAYDAVIATGSNSTGKYFEKYFAHVPHVIRKNRNAVAIITNKDVEKGIEPIASDILDYFGLGCRNVSKLYLEEGVEVDRIFEAVESWSHVANHNKYKNNYDYSYALYLMNKEKFFTNNYLILRPNENIASRIACVHYETFNDINQLEKDLIHKKDQIQCIVSSNPVEGFRQFDFGQAQSPALDDFADGVDTLKFLAEQ